MLMGMYLYLSLVLKYVNRSIFWNMLAHHDTINNIHHRSAASVTKFKMQCLVARGS